MNTRMFVMCIGTAAALAACSGGGGGGAVTTPSAGTATTLQLVTGTLNVALPGVAASSHARKPAYVSAATGHASVFIDGAATPAGSTTSCSATTGTGSGCTITWSTMAAVPASHVFSVEIDTGTNAPANTVLAEGSGSYALVAGANTLAPALSLNGVVVNAAFTVTSCSGASPNSLCNGNVTLSDAAQDAIAYTGGTPVPTGGVSPTSGNVYDNGNVTFVSSLPGVGKVTGTAQAPFSGLAANTLSVMGVNTTGTYTYQVTCVGGITGGPFGITVGGAATPSGIITGAELTGLGLTYPGPGVTTLATAPSFTCTAGVISSATGTIVVN